MAIAIDQANVGEVAADTAGSTIVLTTSATVVAGALIVLTITCVNPQTVSSVSGGGLTWTIDKQGTGGGSSQVAIVSAPAPAGLASGTVITVNLSASTAGGRSCFATSFTGVLPVSPVGTTNGPIATSASTAWATGSTTIAAGSLLIACSSDFTSLQTSTPTAPSIEAHDAGSGGFSQTTCYRIEPAGGTVTIAGTFAAAASGTVCAVEYKAAPDGGRTPSMRIPNRRVGPQALRHNFRRADSWTPAVTGVNQPVAPAAINATSAMTATVTKLALVNPAAINSTSAVTAKVAKLALINPASINSTSNVTATVVKLAQVKPASINATSNVTAAVSKLAAVRLASINATSTVTSNVTVLRAIRPVSLNSTSTITGSLIVLRAIRGASISATSSMTATVTGGSSGATIPLRSLVGLGL